MSSLDHRRQHDPTEKIGREYHVGYRTGRGVFALVGESLLNTQGQPEARLSMVCTTLFTELMCGTNKYPGLV